MRIIVTIIIVLICSFGIYYIWRGDKKHITQPETQPEIQTFDMALSLADADMFSLSDIDFMRAMAVNADKWAEHYKKNAIRQKALEDADLSDTWATNSAKLFENVESLKRASKLLHALNARLQLIVLDKDKR